jgi:hypothetical protein
MMDAVNKGRMAQGEDNGGSKLTTEEALMIRERNDSYREIAGDFGICPSNVWKIKNGVTWGWLNE